MTEITFTDAAIDDLRKIGPSAVPKVLKKVLLLLDSPSAGYPQGGELTGFRKLVLGPNTGRSPTLLSGWDDSPVTWSRLPRHRTSPSPTGSPAD
jgi:hypothetical protein